MAKALHVLSVMQFVISTFVVIGLSILITAILYSKETRKQPFNVYLIGMQLVDLICNIMLAVTMGVYFVHQHLMEDKEYLFHLIVTISVVISSLFVNMYLSAIVAYEVYKLLDSSKRAIRVKPPTIKRVLLQSGIVYAIAISLAIAYIGSTVSTLDDGLAEPNEVIWGWCLLGMVIIPFLFILCITIKIWRRKLLKYNEQTRAIAIYFGRIVSVFVLFYLPGVECFAWGVATVVNDGIDKKGLSRIMIGTILFGFQGAFSLAVALTKDDIREAVRTLLRCNNTKQQQQGEHDDDNNNNNEADRLDDEKSNIKTNGKDSNGTLTTKNDIHDIEEDSMMLEASPYEEQQKSDYSCTT